MHFFENELEKTDILKMNFLLKNSLHPTILINRKYVNPELELIVPRSFEKY